MSNLKANLCNAYVRYHDFIHAKKVILEPHLCSLPFLSLPWVISHIQGNIHFGHTCIRKSFQAKIQTKHTS